MLTFKSSETRRESLAYKQPCSGVRLCQCVSVVIVNTWAGSQPRNNIHGINAQSGGARRPKMSGAKIMQAC